MFKLDLEKAEEPEIKLPASTGSSEKRESSRKNIYFCFIDYAKAFDCVDLNKLKNSSRWECQTTWPASWEICTGQEATVRTGHGATHWFQIRKGVCKGCIVLPYLFNLYAMFIVRNAGLDEAQAGIKTVGRNVNNFRYADNTTLMAENKEELKNLLLKV